MNHKGSISFDNGVGITWKHVDIVALSNYGFNVDGLILIESCIIILLFFFYYFFFLLL